MKKRWGAKRGDRGAVAVETALVFPMLVLITFGIIEYGIYWNSDHTLNEAARSGARLGATKARELGYAEDIANAVTSKLGGMNGDAITYLTIFKADPLTGEPVTGTVRDCTVDCYRYLWDSTNREWDPDGTSEWAPADQAACGFDGHNDYIGVYLEGRWDSATGMFGNHRVIKETSILRLEPVPLTDLCEPAP